MKPDSMPIGTMVWFRSWTGGEWEARVTRSDPWQLGNGEWVASLEGRTGGFCIDPMFMRAREDGKPAPRRSKR